MLNRMDFLAADNNFFQYFMSLYINIDGNEKCVRLDSCNINTIKYKICCGPKVGDGRLS